MGMIFAMRFIFFLFLNLLYPVLRPLIKHFGVIDFITLVYPGKDRDIRSYVLFKGARYIVPTIALVGIFCRDGGRRGLTVATGFSAEEMEKDKELTLKISKALLKFAEKAGAKSVAIVGRMPGIMKRQKIEIKHPIVSGEKGTLFTVTETIKAIMVKEKLFSSNIKIGVLGVGFIGSRLLRELKAMNFAMVCGVDNNSKQLVAGNVAGAILTEDTNILANCDIVIILSSKGDDIKVTIPILKEGVIIVDDTHPPLSRKYFPSIKKKNGKIYKVVLGLGNMISFPRWPNYDNRWLPGCTIEAIVVADRKEIMENFSQEEFDKKASEIGFTPIITEPMGET